MKVKQMKKQIMWTFMTVVLILTLALPVFADTLFIQAESGVGDMLIGSGEGALNGKYIYGEENGVGTLKYEFEIKEAGKYNIWCRVFCTFAEDNSFFVLVDGVGFNDAPYTFDFWEVPNDVYAPNFDNPFAISAADLDNEDLIYNRWYWMPLSYRDATGDPQVRFNPLTFDLAAGKHILEITTREPGARMDKIIITSNLTYNPDKIEGDPELVFVPGFATVEAAAAGKSLISGAQFIAGSASFNNEGPENMFDGDTGTKFCAGKDHMPYWAEWKYDLAYAADRLIIATANDNEGNPRRMCDGWTLSGSNDGSSWNVIYTGKAADYANKNFTFYAIDLPGGASYQFYRLYSEVGGDSDVIQLSEVALCGTASALASGGGDTPAPAAAAPAATPPAPAPDAPPTSDSVMTYVLIFMTVSAFALLIRRRAVK